MLYYLNYIWWVPLTIINTLYFNFKFLPFRQAIKFPVLVSGGVYFICSSGKVTIRSSSLFCVKLGFGGVNIFDKFNEKTIIDISGEVDFDGKASIGQGCRISVSGLLRFGKNFNITANSVIVSHYKVSFGDNVLISWGVLIMDTDFHKVSTSSSIAAPVVIHNDVWICCRVLILKGVEVLDGTVVAANSSLVGTRYDGNSIISCPSAKVIKNGISWTI